jgi:hypothetical protein
MKYKIVSVSGGFSVKSAVEKLTKEVNDAIAIGWEPVGGLVLLGTHYAQAMVKRR